MLMTYGYGSKHDPRLLRSALSAFATGVTVVTTRDEDGTPVGLTANSFNSVSLDPPLVLWSLSRAASCLPVFCRASHWVVHVLSANQQELSRRFASRGERFTGLDHSIGLEGMPLLADCAARFQCRSAFQYAGGDHVILVGQVLQFEHAESDPLVFHGGRYARLNPGLS